LFQEVHGNLTVGHGVAVYRPDMIGRMENVKPRAYAGGINMRFYEDPAIIRGSKTRPKEFTIHDGMKRPSILVMAVPITEGIPIHFDFSGRPKSSLPIANHKIENSQEHILSSLLYYDTIYGFNESRVNLDRRSNTSYFDAHNRLNTLTTRCHYQEFNPETGFLDIIHLSQGHLGRHGNGRTSHKTWDGNSMFFEDQEYEKEKIPPKGG